MKKNKFGFILFLSAFLFSIVACGTDKKEGSKGNMETTITSEKKDILASLGLENQNNVDTWETPLDIDVQLASYMWAGTLEGKILESDNIFVATVDNMETVYPILDEKGQPLKDMPTMNFDLTVLSNIRGELPADSVVKAIRAGFGIDGNTGKFTTAIENDIIPEKGKTYIFLTLVIEGQLVILNGGDVPSNFPLENAPMNLNQQSDEVIQEVVETSKKVEEVDVQAENEDAVFNEIGDTLVNEVRIQERLEGNENLPDLNKIIVE